MFPKSPIAGVPAVGGGGALTPSGVTPGVYGDSTHVSQVTVNTNGIITLAAPVAIAPALRVQSITGASGAQSLNMALYDAFNIHATGNIELDFTGGSDMQGCLVKVVQTVGSSLVTFGVSVQFGTDFTAFTASTAIGLWDYLSFRFNADATTYDFLSFNRGF